MICNTCGAALDDNASFCTNCGATLRAPAGPAYTAYPQNAGYQNAGYQNAGYALNPNPVDKRKIFLYVTLGCLLLSIVFSFFAIAPHINIPTSSYSSYDYGYGYGSYSPYGYGSSSGSSEMAMIINNINSIRIPFSNLVLILVLNAFAACLLLIPIYAENKRIRLTPFSVVCTGAAFVIMIFDWISISSFISSLVGSLGSVLGSVMGSSLSSSMGMVTSYVGIGLSVLGIFALLLQAAAVAGCVMLMLGERKPGVGSGAAATYAAAQPAAPQYQPDDQPAMRFSSNLM